MDVELNGDHRANNPAVGYNQGGKLGTAGLLKKCFSGLMPSFPRRRKSRSFIVLLDARFLGHDKIIYHKRLFQQPHSDRYLNDRCPQFVPVALLNG